MASNRSWGHGLDMVYGSGLSLAPCGILPTLLLHQVAACTESIGQGVLEKLRKPHSPEFHSVFCEK